MHRRSPLCTLNLSAAVSAANAPLLCPPRKDCPTRKRLGKAEARLRNIQLVRNHRNDPEFGKELEERIIWRELLELELQEFEVRDA